MINVYKLQKLPRPQRLRKIWKIFTLAEERLLRDEAFTIDDKNYYVELLKLLAADTQFTPTVLAAIKTSLDDYRYYNGGEMQFRYTQSKPDPIRRAAIHRVFNNIRHLLIQETGRGVADWDMVGADGKLDPSRRKVFSGMWAYFDDIRSPFNVGSMFRSAESFGAEKILLSPLCASQDHPHAVKSAMGCIEILPFERVNGLPHGVPVFALETGGTPLEEFSFPKDGIMIAGSEELGVHPNLLEAADSSLGRVTIPCFGAKGSLSVTVAFGIAMQAWAQSILMMR